MGRSPEKATPDDVKQFQQHLVESGTSVGMRNKTMTGVKFLCRVTLRRPDLVSEIFQLREPKRVPLVLCQAEVKRLLALAPDLRTRTMLSLAYGCGLRASEVVKLRVCDIDSEQGIIRVVQSKNKKDRHVIPFADTAYRLSGKGCRWRSWIFCANGGRSGQPARMAVFRWPSAGRFQAGLAAATLPRANLRAFLKRPSRPPGSRSG